MDRLASCLPQEASVDRLASCLPWGLPEEYRESTVVVLMQEKLEVIKLEGFTNKLA